VTLLAMASMSTAILDEQNKTLETKVVILGHTGVGKTSLVNQYVRGQFTGNTTATIGAAFMKKTVLINSWSVILQIWDTAGQERFRSMAPMYYRGAHAAVLVFDVTAPDTLDKVGGWVEELQGHTNDESIIVLSANKCDLRNSGETCVSPERAGAFAKSIGATVFETSAKTGRGIDDLFDYVATNLLRNELERRKKRADEAKMVTNIPAENNSSGARASTAASGRGFRLPEGDTPRPSTSGGCCS